jgi:hypothetical protein
MSYRYTLRFITYKEKGSVMELLIISVAVFLNFGLLKWKADNERWTDIAVDVTVLGALTFLFGGTMGGMVIALVAGALMSIYLLISPPKFLTL